MSIVKTKKDDILYIDFNAPPVNVLNAALIGEIIETLEQEKQARVVALTGTGKFFCAGVDVKDHLPGKVEAMIHQFSELILRFFAFPGLVASIVQGGAFGGGCEVAFCSDFLIAEKGAKFSQPEIKLGVLPPLACGVYPLLFPSKVINHLIYSGEELSAEELENLGIVNKTFEKQSLFEDAHEYLKRFNALSRPVIQLTKKATNVHLSQVKDNLDRVNAIYLDELMKTEDANEGLKAFLEKRRPVWKNK